jgi:hypothetical protein
VRESPGASGSASPLQQPDDEHHDGDDEEQVNEAAGDVESEISPAQGMTRTTIRIVRRSTTALTSTSAAIFAAIAAEIMRGRAIPSDRMKHSVVRAGELGTSARGSGRGISPAATLATASWEG